ncbi:MAG: 4-hydroxybenzoate octaprenyltransferase [Parvibaculum sp.]|nr:4-hydroxybenzoate octaprenyltransferase [Parvibaculum sp.]
MSETIADAAPTNWVDRHAPQFARPYLKLARADRPIGTWLLLWPCLWSIALAANDLSVIWLMLLFAVGAVVMRGAGCTFNDIVDRDFDAQVERTKGRPLPSGAVTVTQAFVFLVAQLLAGLGILLSLNGTAIALGFASVLLIAVYPFMKRITYWPQIVLGLVFNWGALMGYAAVRGPLDWPPILLYAGAIFWTIGYDTIYAHQDKDDDALIGVKSSALKLGDKTGAALWGFYAAMIAALLSVGYMSHMGFLYYAGVAAAAAHLVWQIRSLDIGDEEKCLRLFRSNREFGLIVFVAIVTGKLVA